MLLALVVGSLSIAVPAEALPGSVTVTPSTGLVDGQTVSVSGSGFTPGASVGWCLGVVTATPSSNNCGTSTIRLGTADAQGGFSGTLQLRRFIFVPSLQRTVDCANPPDACVIGAAEVADVAGTGATAQVEFAPVVPKVVPGTPDEVREGDPGGNLMFPVSLSGPSDEPVAVEWTTLFIPGRDDNQATPGADYEASSGTITFAPGQTSQLAAVPVLDDDRFEPLEYVPISFRDPVGGEMGGFWGLSVGSIIDDEEFPVVVPGVGSIVEGDTSTGTLMVPVRLTNPSDETVTVQWETFVIPGRDDNQAEPPGDYEAASGTVTFAPGQSVQSIAIIVNGDVLVEPDEYIVIPFANATNAAMGGFWGLGVGIIETDD
jgi:hypothetical protein